MIDYTKTIRESKEIATILSALKNELFVDIKKGNMSLYPKYLEVCEDYLMITSLLNNLAALTKDSK